MRSVDEYRGHSLAPQRQLDLLSDPVFRVVQTSSTSYVLRARPTVADDRQQHITPVRTLLQDIVGDHARLNIFCVHEHLVEALIEPVTNAPGRKIGVLAAATAKDLHRVGQYQLLEINGPALRSRKLAFRVGATVSSRKDSWCVRASSQGFLRCGRASSRLIRRGLRPVGLEAVGICRWSVGVSRPGSR
jgi:hypothetical protein